MATKTKADLADNTIKKYTSDLKKLGQRLADGFASPDDKKRIKMLEKLLGRKASGIGGPGRPRKE